MGYLAAMTLANSARASAPAATTPTSTPNQNRPRYAPRVIAAVAVLVVAVLDWNVFQRLNLLEGPSRTDLVAIPETWSA